MGKPIQIGDEIAFSVGFGRTETIYKVDRITPSGRIKAGIYEMNPDLKVRGRSGMGGPYRGVLVTDEMRKRIIAEQKRRQLAYKMSETRWREIPLARLEKIDAILQEAEQE